MKKIEEMTDRELLEAQVKLQNNINKNVRTITTIVIVFTILSIFGAILMVMANDLSKAY